MRPASPKKNSWIASNNNNNNNNNNSNSNNNNNIEQTVPRGEEGKKSTSSLSLLKSISRDEGTSNQCTGCSRIFVFGQKGDILRKRTYCSKCKGTFCRICAKVTHTNLFLLMFVLFSLEQKLQRLPMAT
jgi:hypothetical protein